jgi:isovaleryl-CoA dehydrogenase
MSAGPDFYTPTAEHGMLRDTVRQFVQREVEPQALEHDRNETFNLPLFRKCGELGLLGLTVSEELGGVGMDATAAVLVHEELSASDPGFCLAYLAHTILFVNNLAINGNREQCERLLPKSISGEWVGGMGMSEPGAGTDAIHGMTTTAKREGDRYLLNGRKMWITNGCINDTELGDIFLIYAKTEGGKVSSFIVEKGFPGFSLGQRIKDKTGVRASPTAELVFDNCEVPVANRIGEEGDSVVHMMRNLELERLSLAAMSLGIGRRSVEVMNEYSQERMAFGQSINQFGQIQRHIAESYAEYKAGRAYVYDVARRLNLQDPGNRIDTDGVKLFCAPMGKNAADRAMQVLGGFGYVAEYVVERLWRDAKLLEIGGGTLEAHQKNITRDLARTPHAIY